jgi:3-methyladenine DNA glycosylase AlkD
VSQEKIYHFYLNNIDCVNNWNLVDSSAHHIVGHYLSNKNRILLHDLADSGDLWKRRIAIISTWYFIRNNHFTTTLDIAKILLNDTHDLIHKAVGWMLREIGKKDEAVLLLFLSEYARSMPKTMLRYATEKLNSFSDT